MQAQIATAAPRETARRATFGTHEQTCHVWAQDRYERGRSSDGRILFAAGSIYSHGYHFEMARFLSETFNGNRVVLINTNGYSISTSKHKGIMRHALYGLRRIEIPIPDLRAGMAFDSTELRDSLIRHVANGAPHAREAFEAYRAILNRKARLPADPAGYIAKLDAKAKLDAFRDKLEDARRSASHAIELRDDLKAAAIPECERSYSATSKAERCERVALDCNRAARTLKQGKAAKRLIDNARKGEKLSRETAKAWRVKAGELEAVERRAERIASTREILKLISSGGSDWRARDLTFLGNAIHSASVAYRDAFTDDERSALMARIGAVHYERETDTLHHIANPDAISVELNRRVNAGRKPVTAAEWPEGAKGHFYQERPTLVRRRGGSLETSRGAIAPFRQAVAIYLKATQCRATGKAWHANGEQYEAGAFRLDSIDERGAIRIGCHVISFDEMTRLAIREVPHLVKASYPVPAII